jgi:hypothetical protein
MVVLRKAFVFLVATLLLFASQGCDNEVAPIEPKGKLKKFKYSSGVDEMGNVYSLANGSGNYYYDGNLNLKQYKWFDNDDNQNILFEMHYAYQNNRVHEMKYYPCRKASAPLVMTGKYRYFYGKTGQIDSLHLYQVGYIDNTEQSRLAGKYYFYYLGNRLTSSRTINIPLFDPFEANADGNFLFQEYQYDVAGNLTAILTKRRFPDGTTQDQYRYEYTYDNKPNPRQGIPVYFPDALHHYVSTNNLTGLTFYTSNGVKEMEKQFEYDYNQEGKPTKEIERKIMENNHPTNTTTISTVEYY